MKVPTQGAYCESQIKRRDGVLRGFKIRTGNRYIVERPVQLVTDLVRGAPP